MNRDKQIEEIDEIQTIIYEANHKKSVLDYRWLATELYNANYRKASEVAREIIDKIINYAENTRDSLYNYRAFIRFSNFLTELKKKYESERENNGG